MKKLSLFLVALTMILFSCKPEAEKPTVVTKSVGEITQTTAKIVGQVTADGGAEVTERGVCWNTTGAPEVIDYRTVDGTGIGTFNSNISDLVPNTQYYVRAYATNEMGTSYGDEKSFTTLEVIPEEPEDPEGPEGPENPEQPEDPEDPEQPEDPEDPEQPEDPENPEQPEDPENPEQPEDPENPEQPVGPVVITAEVTEITHNSAKCGGGVSDGGGAAVIERGVCWNTSGNPTVLDFTTKDGSGLGSYISNITGLERNTTYYVRAYAVNANGVAGYGPEVSFTTLERIANGYTYVDLGLPSGLLWATCNVGATTPEEYGDYYAWGETTTKTEYTEDNCPPTYGLSYSELQSQGYIDGEGNLTAQHDAARANWGGTWRMPTYAELNELSTNCTWTWTTQNGVNGYKVTSKVNSNYIFLPAAGYRYGSLLDGAGSYGHYWSSTPDESLSNLAYSLTLLSFNRGMDSYDRSYGQSVRPVIE